LPASRCRGYLTLIVIHIPHQFAIIYDFAWLSCKGTKDAWSKPGQLSLDQIVFENEFWSSDGPRIPPLAVRVPEQLFGKKSKKMSSRLRKKTANGHPKPLKPASPSPL
jgi:hypothetical protein